MTKERCNVQDDATSGFLKKFFPRSFSERLKEINQKVNQKFVYKNKET